MKPIVLLLFVVGLFLATVAKEQETLDLGTLQAQFQTTISELSVVPNKEYEAQVSRILENLAKDTITHKRSVTSTESVWYSSRAGALEQLASEHNRVLIVVSSLEGLYRNSGIGTYYQALADYLQRNGQDVTILYTRYGATDSHTFSYWQDEYAKNNIKLVRLVPEAYTPLSTSSPLVTVAYNVYQYLLQNEELYDIVHVPEFEGAGFFALQAKHQQLHFEAIKFIVGLHGPTRWMVYGNNETLNGEQSVEADYLEQRSVELADQVIAASSYLTSWVEENGWALPSRVALLPFLPGPGVTTVESFNNKNKQTINELVFFGRLETRKGLSLFCDALDSLAQDSNTHDLKVTFLGRTSFVDGKPAAVYIRERAAAWPFELNLYTHKDRTQALAYLQQPGRLAVIPSFVENAPYTAYECLWAGVPFIAADTPSVRALIAPESREATLFELNRDSLIAMINGVVASGAAPATPVFTVAETEAVWATMYTDMVSIAPAAPAVESRPTVSVCVIHRNRPALLEQALLSVIRQSYPSELVEIVLVDDGSDDSEAISYLKQLEPLFEEHSWQLIRTPNKYLGAARNTAARAAKGDLLVFLDDDNYAYSAQLETLVAISAATGAEIVTSAHSIFRGSQEPSLNSIESVWAPLGSSPKLGLFRNCFGDANFLIRRETFLNLGGFTEEFGVGEEDREFLAKAVLDGVSLEACPDALNYYRLHNAATQMSRATDSLANQMRGTRPYMQRYGPEDVMKVLATRRIETRGIEDFCNVTFLASGTVSPSSWKNGATILTITLGNSPSCGVDSIYFGGTECKQLVELAGNKFQCKIPNVLTFGAYNMFVVLKSGEIFILTNAANIEDNGKNGASLNMGIFGASKKDINETALADTLCAKSGLKQLGVECEIGGISESISPSKKRDKIELNVAVGVFAPRNSSLNLANLVGQLAAQLTDPNSPLNQALGDVLPPGAGVDMSKTVVGAVCTPTCVCNPNYSGIDCSVPVPCINDCSGHGACVRTIAGPECRCNSSYSGSDCSIPICSSNCNDHGVCREVLGGSVQCVCDAGWTDSTCSTQTCPYSCQHGVCHAQSLTCACLSGWTGNACDVPTTTTTAGGSTTAPSGTTSGANPLVTGSSDSGSDKQLTALIVVVVVIGALMLTILVVLAVIMLRNRYPAASPFR